MEYRILGKTGLRVSKMGFGGIPLQKTDAAGAAAVMDALVEHGVNFIDTARGYTVSEQLIGEALRGRRDQFVIASKSMSRTATDIERDIDISLANLQTDYIDLYQIHNLPVADIEKILAKGGALEGLLRAKAAGKIRHIGLTAHSIETFERALEWDFVETVMFPYNIVETQGEALIAKCLEKNIGFICMKPLAGGAIEDAALALRFIGANHAVSVIIPGMATPEEVAENANACENVAPLSEAELAAIEEVRRTLGSHFCRRCNYCAPCAAGISIPSVFLFGGYLERYGLENWARDRYATLSKTASDCIGCGACESRCPYELPIRDMMKKYAAKFGK